MFFQLDLQSHIGNNVNYILLWISFSQYSLVYLAVSMNVGYLLNRSNEVSDRFALPFFFSAFYVLPVKLYSYRAFIFKLSQEVETMSPKMYLTIMQKEDLKAIKKSFFTKLVWSFLWKSIIFTIFARASFDFTITQT